MLNARPSGTNCASARMSSTCKAGVSSRRLQAFYGDALTFPRPVALSMTTMPPSAKGLPVGDLVTAVPTWRLQHLVKGLRPSYVTKQLYDPILHCSRNVSRGDDGTVKDDIAPRRATLSFSVTRWTPKEAGAAAQNCH